MYVCIYLHRIESNLSTVTFRGHLSKSSISREMYRNKIVLKSLKELTNYYNATNNVICNQGTINKHSIIGDTSSNLRQNSADNGNNLLKVKQKKKNYYKRT